jgi:leader peptidase (prepilin peptidase) / N-methyltransferase
MALALVVVFGLMIGSFLNVVIARVPERRSIWAPRSACPGCGAAIAWYDNIPVLSFLMLRARCRACATPIPWRYPIVEIATAVLLGAAWLTFGATLEFVIAAALLASLVAITAIDLRHQIIPDVISLPGIVAGALANVASGRLPWTEVGLGIVLGAGIFFAILVAGSWYAGQEAMGLGDVKLAAMLGAFLGWKVLLFSAFLSSLIGGILAAAMMATGSLGRRDPIPFGPFLAAGGATGLFWGERVVRWYANGLIA